MKSPGNARLQPGPENLSKPCSPSFPSNTPFSVPSDAWHSRGYLPHFDGQSIVQHVTFHLADSLPAEAVERMESELISVSPERRDVERRIRVEAWIDAGHGSCILQRREAATLVQSALLFFDGVRYRLHAWVIMPNHVHALFQPMSGRSAAKIVASWKSFTGRRLAPLLTESAANKSQAGAWRSQGAQRRVWHREYWDRFMRDARHYQKTLDYIHGNPVKAGLVDIPSQWRWSSACAGEATLERGDPRGGDQR